MLPRSTLILALLVMVGLSTAFAQGVPSPKHFKVIFENSQVRVLRVYISPSDKTEQHEMRDAVAVPLNDYQVKFIQSDGTSKTGARKKGEPAWVPGSVRVVEAGAQPVEAIVVELKGNPTSAPSAK